MKKKMFLIHPIRNISEDYADAIKTESAFLSQFYEVYDPATMTNQNASEMDICEANRTAMMAANVVGVIWDGKSQGCLFDLGMAFAMGKPVILVTGRVPSMTNIKSFANLLHAWSQW